MAEKCTKTSLPPSTSMKPYPLLLLNHFTRPCVTCPSSLLRSGDIKKPRGSCVPGAVTASQPRTSPTLRQDRTIRSRQSQGRIPGSAVESLEERGVRRILAQLVEQLEHRVVRLHLEEDPPKLVDPRQILLGEQLLLLARTRLGDVDRGVDALLEEGAVENQLHVAGPLELLEDHVVHPGAGIDQRGGDDRQASPLFRFAGRAEQTARLLHGAGVEAARERPAGAGRRGVVRAGKAREGVEQN